MAFANVLDTMNLKAVTSILAGALLALAFAAPASALDANRETALSASKTTFSWEGDPATSITGQFWWIGEPEGDCGTFIVPTQGAIDGCDVTLVSLDGPGSLTVDVPAGDENTNDWDLFVYAADATEQLGASENAGGAESITLDEVGAGDYYVIAVPYQVVNSGYSGKASFTPAPAA
jgi:hypothetical protein